MKRIMKNKPISLRLNEELLEKIDAYASKMSVTRSAAITFIVGSHLQGLEAMEAMQGIKEIYDNERKEKIEA